MLSREEISFLSKEIQEHSNLNYQVLESMADWVRVIDYDGNILYANKSMKDSLGDNIVGMKCYRAHGQAEPCGFCISRRSIETKETIQKEEIIQGRYFTVKSSPVLDNHGQVIAAVEVFRDVTRERKLELELIEKNTKMSNDLLFAKRLQHRILPKAGIYGNLEIEHLYKPCEMLSGDIFDIYYIDEDNIGIYICDVVGHGVTASMMTMFVRQTMRAIKDDILSPSKALSELHQKFIALDLDWDKYFTIFYGVFNTRNRTFKYSNGGHNCVPIKFNDDEISLLKTNGFPVSLIFNKVDYIEKEIKLNLGDKILFYTDGITEAKNIHGEEFEIDGMLKIIEKNEEDILNKIVYNVERFRWGEQKDDLAMVLMKVLD